MLVCTPSCGALPIVVEWLSWGVLPSTGFLYRHKPHDLTRMENDLSKQNAKGQADTCQHVVWIDTYPMAMNTFRHQYLTTPNTANIHATN